jgi:BMFP domain-containing protein YqiC
MPFVLAHPYRSTQPGQQRWAEDQEMQSQNRFFDDLARVAAGAMSTLSGVRGEVESRIREQLERVLAGMDLVSRDEFEAVKAMAAKARSEQEDLEKRVVELESRVAALSASQSAANDAVDQTAPGLSGSPGV